MNVLGVSKPALLWAIYRDSHKISSREGYDRGSAFVQAVNIGMDAESPSVVSIGSYRSDTGTAPELLSDCIHQEDIE